MTTLYYGRSNASAAKGKKFRNALYFQAVEKATKVLVEPGYPKIVTAYEKAGIPVEVVGEAKEPVKTPTKPSENS